MRVITAFILAALVGAVTAPDAAAQTTARGMYTTLQSREQTTRRALDAGKPERVVRRDVQRIVVGYEGLVARFPRNGYADNALWQAAFLAADTFARYRVDVDRVTVGAPAAAPGQGLPGQPVDQARRPGAQAPGGRGARGVRRQRRPSRGGAGSCAAACSAASAAPAAVELVSGAARRRRRRHWPGGDAADARHRAHSGDPPDRAPRGRPHRDRARSGDRLSLRAHRGARACVPRSRPTPTWRRPCRRRRRLTTRSSRACGSDRGRAGPRASCSTWKAQAVTPSSRSTTPIASSSTSTGGPERRRSWRPCTRRRRRRRCSRPRRR